MRGRQKQRSASLAYMYSPADGPDNGDLGRCARAPAPPAPRPEDTRYIHTCETGQVESRQRALRSEAKRRIEKKTLFSRRRSMEKPWRVPAFLCRVSSRTCQRQDSTITPAAAAIAMSIRSDNRLV